MRACMLNAIEERAHSIRHAACFTCTGVHQTSFAMWIHSSSNARSYALYEPMLPVAFGRLHGELRSCQHLSYAHGSPCVECQPST